MADDRKKDMKGADGTGPDDINGVVYDGEGDGYITMEDADGQEMKFFIRDVIDYEKKKYAVLVEQTDDDETHVRHSADGGEEEINEDEEEVISIFFLNEEDQTLETVDEDLAEKVFDYYVNEILVDDDGEDDGDD